MPVFDSDILTVLAEDRSAQLLWEEVSNCDGYIVYGGRSELERLPVIMTCANVTSAQIGELVNGLVYVFKVAAYKMQDNKRVFIHETVRKAAVPFPDIEEFKAVPGDGFITVSWAKSRTLAAASANEYQIFVTKDADDDRSPADSSETKIYYTGENPFIIPNLVNGVSYSVKVRSFVFWDGEEYYGKFSETKTAVPKRTEIVLSDEYLFLRKGETRAVKLFGEDGRELEDIYHWSSSNMNVATVDPSGNIKAAGEGNAIILVDAPESVKTESVSRRRSVYVSVDRKAKDPFYPVPPERFVTSGSVSGIDENIAVKFSAASIMIAGEITCSADAQLAAFKNGNFHWNDSFTYANEMFEDGDFNFAAFSGTLSESMPYAMEIPKIGKKANRNAPACFLDAARFLGFDFLMSDTGNAPAVDVENTKVQFGRYKILYLDKTKNFVVVDIKGIKVGFVYFSEISDDADSPSVAVSEAAKKSDYVIAICRFGIEGSKLVRPEQRGFAQELADSGADYVIGWGSGVLSKFETLKRYGRASGSGANVPVAYSLGKFFSAGAPSRDGVVLHIELRKDNSIKGSRAVLADNSYIPVATFDAFHSIRFPVIPVIPSLIGNLDTPAFETVRENVRQVFGTGIREYGSDTSTDTKSFRICGSGMLSRVFDNITDSAVDNELQHNSVFTLFSPPNRESSLRSWHFASKSTHHNITKDVHSYCRISRTDYFVLDLYYTAVTPVFKIFGAYYTGNKNFTDTAFYTEHADKADKITPYFLESVWRPLMDHFITELLKIYEPAEIILVRTVPYKYYAMKNNVRAVKNYDSRLADYVRSLEDYFLERVNCVVIDISSNFFGDHYSFPVPNAVSYDKYYFEQLSNILRDIAGGNVQSHFSDIIEPSIWMRRFLYYYDSIRACNMFDVILDYDYAADVLARYSSKEFIKIYYDKFIEIRKAEYSTLDSVLENYCKMPLDNGMINSKAVPVGMFGEGAAAVNAILKESVYNNFAMKAEHELMFADGNFDLLFDYDFEVLNELVPLVRKKLTDYNLSENEIITKNNVKFYFSALKFYFKTYDIKVAIEAIRTNSRANAPIKIDVWGSDVSTQSLKYNCENLYVCNEIVGCPFAFAFYEPIEIDKSRIEASSEFSDDAVRTSVLDNLLRGLPVKIGKSDAQWIVLDFWDLTLPVAEYWGEYFAVTEIIENSGLFEEINDKIALGSFMDFNSVALADALDDFCDLVMNKYGNHIILNRIKLKQEYVSIDGESKIFPDTAQILAWQKLITKYENDFIERTNCYVIDLSDYFHADDNYPIGGASPAHYEEMFYRNTGNYISKIAATVPNLKLFDILNPILSAEALIGIKR